MSYRRTPKAPRLTTPGNTFHGMKKELIIEILKHLTRIIPNALVLEIDMSACHSRITASLLKPGSMIEQALESTDFWKNKVDLFLPLYKAKGIDLPDDRLKKMLKVMLYTSLNGGNPASHDRLTMNLLTHARDFKPKNHFTSSDLYLVTKQIAEEFVLVIEVKGKNKHCFINGHNDSYTYTLDRLEPYKNGAAYKGISKVLQSFEVILLTCLTPQVVKINGLPLSLDHDGFLAMFILDETCSKDSENLINVYFFDKKTNINYYLF